MNSNQSEMEAVPVMNGRNAEKRHYDYARQTNEDEDGAVKIHFSGHPSRPNYTLIMKG
jgi:hypothetical protein